jgi:hypothetical protein
MSGSSHVFFFSPRCAAAKQLEIFYQYNGNPHWCTIEEDQDILLPMKGIIFHRHFIQTLMFYLTVFSLDSDHELTLDEMEMLREAPEVRKEQRLRKKKMARGMLPFSSTHSAVFVLKNMCEFSCFARCWLGIDGAVLVVWCVAVRQEVRIVVFRGDQKRPIGHGASEQGRLAQIVNSVTSQSLPDNHFCFSLYSSLLRN